MCMKVFVFLVILVAIAVGLFTLFLPRDQIVAMLVFREFFDVALPILGFGALVKYLCTCGGCGSCK